jgi:hypothetical protein
MISNGLGSNSVSKGIYRLLELSTYYWAAAFVTPVKENGQIVRYESVRYKPQPDQINIITRFK